VIKAKPFDIPKREIWEAFKHVKTNQGAAGVDGQSIEDFEARLGDNLYKLWNRLSSGSYMPPPVRRVDIPKANGGTRPLGIPTVADRVAQEVVRRYLEPLVEPMFHEDSYGYRPGRSAIDAIRTARQRCWRYDWVVDIDIKGFLDASSHYTFRFFERVEEVRSGRRYLNSYAFCPSAVDVNGLKFAALYTLQDGLP
jgi:RNA-directed DNA polymerase